MNFLKNSTRDRKGHQLTVYSCLQNPKLANALQSVRMTPCLPSIEIPSGEMPMKCENFFLRREPMIGKVIISSNRSKLFIQGPLQKGLFTLWMKIAW